MKKKPDPRIFIILAALTLLGGGGLLWTQFDEVSQMASKVETLRAEVKDDSELSAELEKTEAQLSELREKLNHLEMGIPDIAFIPTMLKELEAVGKTNGIQVIGMRPLMPKNAKKDSKEERRKPYNELDIEMKGRGKFTAVLQFVKALDTFPKIVSARTVSMEPKLDPQNPNAPALLEITIAMRAYVFKPETENKDDDADKPVAAKFGGPRHEG